MQISSDAIAITGSYDKTLGIWNLARRGSPTILRGHKSPVLTVAKGDDLIASGCRDGALFVWDYNSGNSVL